MSKRRSTTGSAKQYRALTYRKGGPKCPSGKVRYATAIDAGIALGKARTGRVVKGRDQQVEVRHYPCNLCGGYHLTSKPQITERRS